MISKYSKYEFGKLKIEANYDGASTPCKAIKFTLDGKEEIISSADLYALLMLYADEEQMAELVTVREKKVRFMRKAVKVTAKKNIKAGEDVVFVIEYPVDEEVYKKVYGEDDHFISQDEAVEKLS